MTELEIYGGFLAISILLLILAVGVRLRGHKLDATVDFLALIPTVLGVWAFVDELQDVRILNKNFQLLNERFNHATHLDRIESQYSSRLIDGLAAMEYPSAFCTKLNFYNFDNSRHISELFQRSAQEWFAGFDHNRPLAQIIFCEHLAREVSASEQLARDMYEIVNEKDAKRFYSAHSKRGRIDSDHGVCISDGNKLFYGNSKVCIRLEVQDLLMYTPDDKTASAEYPVDMVFGSINGEFVVGEFLEGLNILNYVWDDVSEYVKQKGQFGPQGKLEAVDESDQYLWAYLLSFAIALEIAKILSAPIARGIMGRRGP